MEREYQQLIGIECKVIIDGYTDFVFLNRDGGTFYQGSLNKTIRRIIRDCNDEEFAGLDSCFQDMKISQSA